jgi:hypothetical protein
MSITIERAPKRWRRAVSKAARGILATKILLACGIAYGVLYIVANDVIAATIFDGYSRADQAISELSGTEAPSRPFLTAMLSIFTLVVIGFGIGVWKAAQHSRALRATGGILVAQGIMFPLWLLFPMTSREEMVQATTPANDVGHLILGALAILFIIAEIGFSAAAFGKRFRVFSVAMAVTVLVFGAVTGMLSSEITAGHPTPWMGVVERISYGAWLLWMGMLAVVLLRTQGPRQAQSLSSTSDTVDSAAEQIIIFQVDLWSPRAKFGADGDPSTMRTLKTSPRPAR